LFYSKSVEGDRSAQGADLKKPTFVISHRNSERTSSNPIFIIIQITRSEKKKPLCFSKWI